MLQKLFCFKFSGMLDDTYALCEAGEESILSLLSLMDLYRDDLDYLVLSRLISVHLIIYLVTFLMMNKI